MTGRPTGWRQAGGVAGLVRGWVPLAGIATERAYYFTLNGILVAFRGRNE